MVELHLLSYLLLMRGNVSKVQALPFSSLKSLVYSVKTIKKNWLPRFKCFEPWRQCYFAAHPRQFVTADRTVVKLLDSRVSPCLKLQIQNYISIF